MAANDYHFVTTWRIAGTPEEISAILGDAATLDRWWPSVYLEVAVREPGDELGRGKIVDLYTKGWLPYTLRWWFVVSESTPPLGFRLEAKGDFVGRGIWSLAEDPVSTPERPVTNVTYDWLVVAEKGVLKRLSFLMKPIFSANHHWAMARGADSLRLELARRRAADDATLLAAIPRPPGPTFPHNIRARLRSGRSA